MSEYNNHYEVLGVRRGASKKEIKKKFYELAKKYHPDVNNDDSDAEAKFKRINEAYSVLTSDRERHDYDYNVNQASNVRPRYNYDGSPFYNFDIWYTMHYGKICVFVCVCVCVFNFVEHLTFYSEHTKKKVPTWRNE